MLRRMSANKVTIVVPVYADWPSLKECIESLKKHAGEPVAKVMLVNDCGPEADDLEKNIQLAIKGAEKFKYYRNTKNLGFVGNCNNAVFNLDKTDNDILLLNSDTRVTPGFGEEMIGVLYSSDNIGVVSPRSNNATICTFPLSAIKQKGIQAEKSYELFLKFNSKFPKYNIAPTGHGFCMLIRRSLIKKYGLFDSVFGRGYGEEVDFCQRIGRQGWSSVLSNRSYVFHHEARSFSLDAKEKLLKEHNKIIRARYPNYKQTVSEYIAKALDEESKIIGNYDVGRIKRKLKATINKLTKLNLVK